MATLEWTAVGVVAYLVIGFGIYVWVSIQQKGLKGYLLHLTTAEDRKTVRVVTLGWFIWLFVLGWGKLAGYDRIVD